MCACGKSKNNAVTSVQAAQTLVAGGEEVSPDEIRKINKVRTQQSVNNAAANAGS